MTPEKRDELRRLAEAATPGVWANPVANGARVIAFYEMNEPDGSTHPVAFRGIVADTENFYYGRDNIGYPQNVAGSRQRWADAHYIVAAQPKTIIALLDALDEAEARREAPDV